MEPEDSGTRGPSDGSPERSGSTARTNCPPPLEGIRGLDFTRVIAGPYCTMMLADLGAEVVKVEEPGGGDELRWVGRYEGRGPEDEDYFYTCNRSKKSVILNLKHPAGRLAAQSLARCADVVVENFAPGGAERLGVGWEQLHPLNPRLVYCAISGFGQDGPYRDRPALDPIVQAMSGLMSVTGRPGAGPTQVGAPVADVIAGMFAAYAVLGALLSTQRGGQGCFIDISMLDAMIAVLGPRMGEPLQAGVTPRQIGNENPLRVPAGTFEAADGESVCFIVQNDRYWARFCAALERDIWISDPRFASAAQRLRHRGELNALIRARLRELPAQEWLARLESRRIPAAVINDYNEALSDPQVIHRGLVRHLEHPRSGMIRVVGPPWTVSGTRAPMLLPPPLLGQHTAQVLQRWLGWSATEVERLRAEGAT